MEKGFFEGVTDFYARFKKSYENLWWYSFRLDERDQITGNLRVYFGI